MSTKRRRNFARPGIIYYTHMRNRTQHKLHANSERTEKSTLWYQLAFDAAPLISLSKWHDWRVAAHRSRLSGHRPLGWRDRSE